MMETKSRKLLLKILCAAMIILSFPAGISAVSEAELEGREEIAKLITCEMKKDAPYICKVAFAAMILNRVKSLQFPDTISGVIMEYRSFASVRNGKYFSAVPYDEALRASRDALLGADPANGAVYCFPLEDEIMMYRAYMEKTLGAWRYVFYK